MEESSDSDSSSNEGQGPQGIYGDDLVELLVDQGNAEILYWISLSSAQANTAIDSGRRLKGRTALWHFVCSGNYDLFSDEGNDLLLHQTWDTLDPQEKTQVRQYARDLGMKQVMCFFVCFALFPDFPDFPFFLKNTKTGQNSGLFEFTAGADITCTTSVVRSQRPPSFQQRKAQVSTFFLCFFFPLFFYSPFFLSLSSERRSSPPLQFSEDGARPSQ